MRGLERLRTTASRLADRYRGSALILMYHRVAGECSDPWSLCVSPEHFEEHLEVLRERARPIPLRQLVGKLGGGRIPSRSVVVTFDDGYADNLHNAKPLLERYDIPATVFVTTGHLEREGGFWWDELDGLFLRPGALPQTLRLSIEGEERQWELGEVADYDEARFLRHRDWRTCQAPPTLRHSLYYSLWQLLQPMREGERQEVMDELRAWAGATGEGQAGRVSLTPDELSSLAQCRLVEIGAHTVTHPVLSALPAASQQKEVQQSKARLEEILNRPVMSFAYPYGARCNYTDETVAIVREAGFTSACSTLPGLTARGADRFQLPRVQAEDWDGEAFARRLSFWFDGTAGSANSNG